MRRFLSILLLLALVAGGAWLGWMAAKAQLAAQKLSKAADECDRWAAGLTDAERDARLKAAEAFNAALERFAPGEADADGELPDLSDGALATLEVPRLGVRMSVAATEVEEGAFRMPGTSLPVGGASTHAVIAGSTGQMGAAGLDSVEKGDLIYVRCLGRTLIYQAESAQQSPDLTGVKRVPGGDYLTLASPEKDGWRLVRARRLTREKAMTAQLASDAQPLEGLRGALICAVPFAAALLALWLLLALLKAPFAAARRRKGKRDNANDAGSRI